MATPTTFSTPTGAPNQHATGIIVDRPTINSPNYQAGLLTPSLAAKFGGVRLDDMVISSVSGWQLNGNQNRYQIPDASDILDGAGNIGYIFQAGIQTLGFFSLPVCTESQITDVIDKISGNQGSPSWNCWPCG
jgi:hypothetical protein